MLTRITPALAEAYWTSSHSAQFGAQIPMRSPGASPAARRVRATPFAGGRAAAQETLDHAVERLREAGLEADGAIGDSDPVIAVTETWDPTRYDEIVVSTLPIGSSKWLHAGLPERIAKVTGAP